MSHIAIDARIINSSTGTYVERLLHYLEQLKTNHTYSVIVPTKDKDYWVPTNPNFTIVTADFANYSLAEQFGFMTFLNKLNADLVHFCMPQQPLGYRGRSVTTFHDLTLLRTYNSDKNWLLFHLKQFIGSFVFRRVAHKTTHIITPSEYTKQDLLRTFRSLPSDKITVSYEAADITIGELQPYAHPYKTFILYVGQQSDYKNIRRLGDAHQKLLKTQPDLGLILVGKLNDSAKKNKAYFEQKGYTNILFTDFIPNAQRDWLYTKAVAYVFPSLVEGFGLPGLEAMAYGTPVVSSNASCLPEIYGRAAHYFDPLDTVDMARALTDVTTRTSLQKQLRTAGTAQHKKYSWKKMARETQAVYDDALNS